MEKYSLNYSTKRKTPFKRAFSRFKRRRNTRYPIFKNPSFQEMTARGEYMDALYCPGLGNTYLHQNNTSQYMNFYQCFNFMSSITGLMTEFEMYKITAVSYEVMPCVDSYGVTFTYGAPCIAIGVDPVEVSVSLGSTAFSNDTALISYLNRKTPVRKYISYPNNYYNGVVLGIGTWNKTTNYASQVGEFCTYMPDTNTNLSGSNTYMWTVKYSIYVSFKQRSR